MTCNFTTNSFSNLNSNDIVTIATVLIWNAINPNHIRHKHGLSYPLYYFISMCNVLYCFGWQLPFANAPNKHSPRSNSPLTPQT